MKTEEEKKENAEKFLAELKELAKKYEAKHLSVCCELEKKIFGIVGADIEGYGDFFEASLKVGRLNICFQFRLYQHPDYGSGKEKQFNR